MKKTILILSTLQLIFSCVFSQGIMTTCVGTGVAGYSGDNGMASLAAIYGGNDVCMDASGNIYIADAYNNVVRKVSVTGIITTVAGNNTAGYSGDGGPATDAQLKLPAYICLDPFGNLYISEGGPLLGNPGNATVRKVTPGGIISTVAHLVCPKALCSDKTGNIFVADEEANMIVKISPAGITSTIAGNRYSKGYTGDGGPASAALLDGPTAIGINAAGDLFFSDQIDAFVPGCFIRKISAATGAISTIAGTGVGMGGDGGPALNAGLGYIFGIFIDGHDDLYCNEQSCASRKIDMSTGIINILAGDYGTEGYNGDGTIATAEFLKYPGGLWVDPTNGNILIADMGNNRIRTATQPDYNPTVTGIKNISATAQYDISPNPSNGIFVLKTTEPNTDIAVYNEVGQVVYIDTQDRANKSIDLRNEPDGLYFVEMKNNSGREVKKFIIKK